MTLWHWYSQETFSSSFHSISSYIHSSITTYRHRLPKSMSVAWVSFLNSKSLCFFIEMPWRCLRLSMTKTELIFHRILGSDWLIWILPLSGADCSPLHAWVFSSIKWKSIEPTSWNQAQGFLARTSSRRRQTNSIKFSNQWGANCSHIIFII